MTIRRSVEAVCLRLLHRALLAGCQTAPPPPLVVPAAFTPLGIERALSLGRRDRRPPGPRSENARREDPAAHARRKLGAYMADLDASCGGRPPGIGLDVLQVGGSIVIRDPGDLHLRRGQRGGQADHRRDPARDRADGENPQPHLRRRPRAHRHDRQRRRATRRCPSGARQRSRPILPRMACSRARIASRGLGESAPLYNPETSEDAAGREPPDRDPARPLSRG